MPSRRTIVVGDIHGCLDELTELLERCELQTHDTLISVGDLVGKGPDGAGVVRFFREGGHAAVRGNHDDKILSHRDRVARLPDSHRRDAEALGEADWRWLESRPLCLDLPDHHAVVVHAGFVPGVPRDEQTAHLMMNLRSIQPDGTPTKRIDEDSHPWAERWTGPELVIFGHDAVRGLQRHPFAIGLDTGCVYGRELSALILPDREIRSVPAARAYAGPG